MYYFLLPLAVLITIIISLMLVNISINIVFNSLNKSSDSQNKNKSDLRIFIRYGLFTFYLFPERAEKRDKKKKPKIGKQVTKVEKTVSKVTQDLITGEYKLSEVIELIKEITAILAVTFKKYLKLTVKSFVITVAADDAHKTALNYGTAIQAAYYLHEFLNLHFNISSDDIKIYSDFEKTKTEYNINMKFSIKIWHALKTIIHALIKFQDSDKNITKDKINK